MQRKETITKFEEVTDSVVIEVTCNKCGASSTRKNEHDHYFSNEFQTFHTNFGYGSKYDNERWEFDLCDDCLTELLKTFMYGPSGFGQDSHIAHDEQATFQKWKETGVVDLEAGMTKEEIEKNGGSIYGED